MKKHLLYWVFLLLVASCSVHEPTAELTLDRLPEIYPDYKEVTIPANIAPLRFKLMGEFQEAVAVLSAGPHKLVAQAEEGKFCFSESAWKELLSKASGQDITALVYQKANGKWEVFQDFSIHVAPEEIDSHVVYRLIPPGYEPWYQLGIYQRDLTTFQEKAIIENTQTDHNCINCHNFNLQNPEEGVLHMRAVHGGTYILKENNIEKLGGKVDEQIPSLVYPNWHPGRNFIAFSTNKTMQAFHRNDSNRIEVYDERSDVLVYDLKNHKVFTTDSILASPHALETFPAFSPDGKSLYFCSAEVPDSMSLPRDYKKIKYSLCRVDFHADTQTFGHKIDTLYNARQEGRSAKFPRVSPDGNHLVFTLSDYGNFSIWHHDADLFICNLKEGKDYRPMKEANSTDTESFHSWSSNSRWMIFSSRRDDGLYTRLYITYIDKDGHARKAFMLPQEDPDFYTDFMFSYNIPELVKGEVTINSQKLIETAKNGKTVQITR